MQFACKLVYENRFNYLVNVIFARHRRCYYCGIAIHILRDRRVSLATVSCTNYNFKYGKVIHKQKIVLNCKDVLISCQMRKLHYSRPDIILLEAYKI